MVAFNHIYLEGRGRRILGSRTPQDKLTRLSLKNKIQKKELMAWLK
jgi:hypothetical protein